MVHIQEPLRLDLLKHHEMNSLSAWRNVLCTFLISVIQNKVDCSCSGKNTNFLERLGLGAITLVEVDNFITELIFAKSFQGHIVGTYNMQSQKKCVSV